MKNTGRLLEIAYDTEKVCVRCENGQFLTLTFAAAGIPRIRLSPTPNPENTVMVKLGFVKESLEPAAFAVKGEETYYSIRTAKLELRIYKEDCTVEVCDLQGRKIICGSKGRFLQSGEGTRLCFAMRESEHFYGFGFQRKVFDARGAKLKFTKEYRWDEATVPFFMSTGGYGFFSVNTYDQTFDFTEEKGNQGLYTVQAAGGNVDFFLITGASLKEILDDYTSLSGKPYMPPKWAFGLCYIARYFENDKGLLDIAKTFRQQGIPCDMLGLEPGWEEKDYSMAWIWSKERFPDPAKTIGELKELGYRFELWESGEAPLEGYLDPEVRRQWFQKRVDASIGIGVDFFKQDDPYPRCISTTEMVAQPIVNKHAGGSGEYSAEETRNITNTLYSDTVFEEVRRLTNKRMLMIFHAYNATISSQKYPLSWGGDFALGNGAWNGGLSGHSMVSQDMNNHSSSGLHFGFLTPFSLIDSWASYSEPWLYSKGMQNMHRMYSRLRNNLSAYLYTAAYQSHTTGVPILRPMLLEFPEDQTCCTADEQYMLGDSFLVGINEKVYLPKGQWVDYWTGTRVESQGEWKNCQWPAMAGGPLFARAGAVVPMAMAEDTVMQCDGRVMLLNVYPQTGSGRTQALLYEDDGVSFAYENREHATTEYSCTSEDDCVTLKIGKRQGDYEGKTPSRAYLIRMHQEKLPATVHWCDQELQEIDNLDELLYGNQAGWYYDCLAKTVYIKPERCWHLAEKVQDLASFYHACPETEQVQGDGSGTLTVKTGRQNKHYGTVPSALSTTVQYEVLLCDGVSSTQLTAQITDEKGRPVKAENGKVTFTLSGHSAQFTDGSIRVEATMVEGRAQAGLVAARQPGTVRIIAEVWLPQQDAQPVILRAEPVEIQVVQGTFDIVLNPMERVHLKFEDNWLPYHVYPYVQITHQGTVVASAQTAISLRITGNEEREITRSLTVKAKDGNAEFGMIVLGKPTDGWADVQLHFSCEGVEDKTVHFRQIGHSDNVMWK